MYFSSIDVLRGISILLVLLHHFNIPYKLHTTFLGVPFFGEPLSALIARNGNYGVTMFFVISGFLITQQSLKRYGQLSKVNIAGFYIRRIARIIPNLVLLVVCVSILGCFDLPPFVNHAPNGVEVSFGKTVFAAFTFWMNILIIHYGWVNYALGVLWSLSVEEVFYLAFPILCLLTRRTAIFVILLCAIIAYAPYFRSLYFLDENEAYLYHYFSSFDAIAIGCLTALLWQNIDIRWLAKKWVQLCISVLLILLYCYAPIKEVSTWSMTVFACLTATLILSFKANALKEKVNQVQVFWKSTLAWLGKRSYELYLFHLIILGLIKVFFIPAQTSSGMKLILLIVFFIASCLLVTLIEKYYAAPLNRKIRLWFLGEEKSKI